MEAYVSVIAYVAATDYYFTPATPPSILPVPPETLFYYVLIINNENTAKTGSSNTRMPLRQCFTLAWECAAALRHQF